MTTNKKKITSHNLRITARLDIKGDKVVKGINLEGIRKVGDPKILAKKYYNQGIDEIIYMDVVASLYGRNTITEFIKETAKEIFVPLTVGGGIRNLSDIRSVLKSGADKVAINTQAIKKPDFIKEASEAVGSQAIVVSIEAKKQANSFWEAYYDNGREKSGINVLRWASQVEKLGAGELLVTSVDKEGLKQGMDIELLSLIRKEVSIPIIFSGGVGNAKHIIKAAPYADGVAIASILHYNESDIKYIKRSIYKEGVLTRLPQ